MYFQWNDSLDTGIEEIDVQHRRIVDFINKLHHAQQTGDRDEVAEVLEALLDYTVNHFLFEEKLMEEAGYEFFSAHQRVHDLFGKRVAEYRQQFAEGKDVAGELLEMLRNWLSNHIQEEDRGYLSAVQTVVADEGRQKWISGLVKRLFG